MKIKDEMKWLCSGLFVIAVAMSVSAEETAFSYDFKDFDPAKLPAGWSVEGAGEMSLVTDPGFGKALRIDHKAGAAPSVSLKFDATKIQGLTAQVTIELKGGNEKPPADGKPCGAMISLSSIKKGGSTNKTSINGLSNNYSEFLGIGFPVNVSADCESIVITIGTNENPGDVYYKSVTVKTDKLKAEALKAKAAAETPTGAAVGAPSKTLEVDGFIFDAALAHIMHNLKRPEATVKTFTMVGPGMPLKDVDLGVQKTWTRIEGAKEVTGATVTPDILFATLPKFIVASKPEIVLIVGPSTGTRKAVPDERFDWQDIAAICTRFGAVPVFILPPVGTQDEIRKYMLDGATLARCPVLDIKSAGMVSVKTRELFDLIEKHIFDRAVPAVASKKEEKKPDNE